MHVVKWNGVCGSIHLEQRSVREDVSWSVNVSSLMSFGNYCLRSTVGGPVRRRGLHTVANGSGSVAVEARHPPAEFIISRGIMDGLVRLGGQVGSVVSQCAAIHRHLFSSLQGCVKLVLRRRMQKGKAWSTGITGLM